MGVSLKSCGLNPARKKEWVTIDSDFVCLLDGLKGEGLLLPIQVFQKLFCKGEDWYPKSTSEGTRRTFEKHLLRKSEACACYHPNQHAINPTTSVPDGYKAPYMKRN